MRWTRRVGLFAALLLLIYTVWPLVDLYRLARALETRDAAALARLVDLNAIRGSVARQVLDTYLVRSGQSSRLGSVGRSLVVGAGAALAMPALAELTAPERVADLLAVGWPHTPFGSDSAPRVRIPASDFAALWQLYMASEYRFRRYQVSAPTQVPRSQRFGLTLYFGQWRWKLSDVELPEHLRVRLADEIIKATRQ